MARCKRQVIAFYNQIKKGFKRKFTFGLLSILWFLFFKKIICFVLGDSDDLALKIALPVLTVLIILLLSAIAVVFYKR